MWGVMAAMTAAYTAALAAIGVLSTQCPRVKPSFLFYIEQRGHFGQASRFRVDRTFELGNCGSSLIGLFDHPRIPPSPTIIFHVQIVILLKESPSRPRVLRGGR